MTRILVLSDTHLVGDSSNPVIGGSSARESYLFDRLNRLRLFASVDLIIHAGDFTGTAFYNALLDVSKLVAVHGNMDSPEIMAALPERTDFQCEGLRLGLMHGSGARSDLPERVGLAWLEQKPDMVIFGHSHQVCQQDYHGIRLFNPGSPSRPFSGEGTVGWLEIEGSRCQSSIVSVD